MKLQHYPWSRYWYLRDGVTPLTNNGLLTPWHDLGEYYSRPRSLFELQELLDIPCLILLGEAGMGKSQVLRDLSQILQDDAENRYRFFNLADFTTPSELASEVFVDNQDVDDWKHGNFNLHLFLDGLDEAIVQIKPVVRRLQKYLVEHVIAPERFFLRISCRTADWPSEIETHLVQTWATKEPLDQNGEEDKEVASDVMAFILGPLQQEDVLLAGQSAGINPERFWDEIAEQGVEIFASRPVTLNFLVDEFRTTGSLPQSRWELYEKGCAALCRDISVIHSEVQRTQPEQRIILAARMAAFTIFTASAGIIMSGHADDEQLLKLQDCTHHEPDFIFDRNVDLWEKHLAETLHTALFRGREVRKWEHKNYAEFLAVWYIVKKLSILQIKSLIFHSDRHLVPQLTETAAWIASYHPEIFDEILKTDPQVLLRSDIVMDEGIRKRLTLALLEKCRTYHRRHYLDRQLAGLKHRDLPTTIEPYLRCSDRDENVRELAIDIVVQCKESRLFGDLVDIALDSNEPLRLRVNAAFGIKNVGDQEYKRQLKPLAFLSIEDRYYGDLKYCGIQVTWPFDLSAEELFGLLAVPPIRPRLADFYVYEKWAELILPSLNVDDIPIALRWVAKQELRDHDLPDTFTALMDAILLFAWEHLGEMGVVEVFASTAVSMWQRHRNVVGRRGWNGDQPDGYKCLTREMVKIDENKRCLLRKHLISSAIYVQDAAIHFFYDIPFLTYADVPWLAEQFDQSANSQEKSLIVELIRRSIDLYASEQFSYIYYVGIERPDLWKALNFQLSTSLDSEAAEEAKRHYQLELEHEAYKREAERRRNKPLLSPSPIECVRQDWKRFNVGDLSAWWQMCRWMVVKPDGTYEHVHERDHRFDDLPVWEMLEDDERDAILDSVATYLMGYGPDKGQWWEKRDWIHWPIVAGCRALFALVSQDRFDELPLHAFRKWAPALTMYVYQALLGPNEEQERIERYLILKVLKLLAPNEVIETFVWIAECENEDETFFLASRIEEIWDDQLAEAMIVLIQEEKFSTANAFQLLNGIAAYKYELVESTLNSWFISPPSTDREFDEKDEIAAQLLLQYAPDAGWPRVWPAMKSNLEFGMRVVRRIVFGERHGSGLVGKLKEVDIADFCVWLFEQHPPENDPPRNGMYQVTAEHALADLREGLLNHLVGVGSPMSVTQLKRIQERLGMDLSRRIEQAQIVTRQTTWQPVSPTELRSLLHSPSSRFVQDETQLLDVLEELFAELNRELQGANAATPAAIDLWSEYPHGKSKRSTGGVKYTPKDEERLSDYVERFLKRELEGQTVFVGRETQIRRGNYTDILIEAKPMPANGEFTRTLSVVVEVKGCWHSELKTAMHEQLATDYLKPHQKRHGVYLVGRFFCDAWTKAEDENRWKASARIDDNELQAELNDQAVSLVQEGYDIRLIILDARLRA